MARAAPLPLPAASLPPSSPSTPPARAAWPLPGTSAMGILAEIGAEPGVHQAAIARELSIREPRVSALIRRLLAARLVARSWPAATPGRAHLTLTAAGRAYLQASVRGVVR